MDRNAQGEPNTAPSTTRWARLFAPIRRLQSRLDAARERPAVAAAGIAGLLLFTVGLGIIWTLVLAPKVIRNFDEEFAPVIAHLDAGEYELARRGATQLRQERWSFEQLGGPVYILGAVMARDADEHWDPVEQENLYLIASRYLEEARDRGFPKGRKTHATYLLGYTMFHGGRLAESIPYLEKSLKLSNEYDTELHLLLTIANLRKAAPDVEKAERHNAQLLQQADLETQQQLQGMILRGEILLKLGRYDEAQKTLNDLFVVLKPVLGSDNILELNRLPTIPQKELATWQETASEAFVLATLIGLERVKQLQAADRQEGTNSTEEIAETLNDLRDRLLLARERHLDSSPSNYLLGRVYELQGQDDAALTEFILVRRKDFASDEGVAGAIHEAEILLEQARPEDAIRALRRVLPDIKTPSSFNNRWLTLADLRSRVRVMYASFLDTNAHDEAVAIAEMSDGVFAQAQAIEMRADAQSISGRQAALEAEQLPSNFRELRLESRRRYTAAGRAYEELADMRFATREYTDYLWKSASAYQQGNDYDSVVRILRKYLSEESRNRRPHALTMLGEAQLAQGRSDEALRTLTDAISQYPTHPITYRARIASAHLHLEKQHVDEAKRLLNDNLENGVLTPRSLDWQESLFLLGRTFHNEGLEADRLSRDAGIDSLDPTLQRKAIRHLEDADEAFERCIRRLREYVLRAPNSRRAVQAQYMIAESLRMRSKLPRAKLRTETIETVRATLATKRQSQLQAAYNGYHQLIVELNRRQDLTQLGPIDSAVLRNCYFLSADTLYAMERYDEAIQAYSSATSRYQVEPASLDAYLQMAACYRRLGNPKKARGSLEQAKVILAKMPADLPYEKTSRFNREQWEQHLQ